MEFGRFKKIWHRECDTGQCKIKVLGVITLNGNLKGKSKRQTNSANERKFRIFSEAVWAVADSFELLGERAHAAPAVPGRGRSSPPHLRDAWLRAELLGLETNQCLRSPAPGFTKPFQHGGIAQISEQILRTREQGRSQGQQSSRPPLDAVCTSRSAPCVEREGFLPTSLL